MEAYQCELYWDWIHSYKTGAHDLYIDITLEFWVHYCSYFTVLGSKTPLGPKRALGRGDHLRVLSVPQNMCRTQMEARSGSPGTCHHTSIYISDCGYTKRR